jgi:hypothetical protein
LEDWHFFVPAVKKLTSQEYKTPAIFPLLFWTESYIGLLVIASGTWYRHGVKMQQEQALTI